MGSDPPEYFFPLKRFFIGFPLHYQICVLFIAFRFGIIIVDEILVNVTFNRLLKLFRV